MFSEVKGQGFYPLSHQTLISSTFESWYFFVTEDTHEELCTVPEGEEVKERQPY